MEEILREFREATGYNYDSDPASGRSSPELRLEEVESDVDDEIFQDGNVNNDVGSGDEESDADLEENNVGVADRNEENRWSQTSTPVNVEPCLAQPGPQHTLGIEACPMDYFSLFMPDQIFELISDQTNLYADFRQQTSGVDKLWKPTTAGDIKVFTSILYMMGIHKLPEYSLYWSSDDRLKVPGVADVMSKSRYEKISQYFHFNDSAQHPARNTPTYDPLYKVRPLLNHIRACCTQYFSPGTHLSFDEAMVAYNGRLSFKQYIPSKPHPYGIKVWCIADPTCGYLIDFDVYTGKINEPMQNGIGHHVIMKLGRNYLGKYHQFYYDNYFSSVKLAVDLLAEKTYVCSTIRVNRKGWPSCLKKKKKMKRGEIEMRQNGNLLAILWQDKRQVAILSTNSNPEIGEVNRRTPQGRIEGPIPAAILSYNSYMGGVDLVDQLHSYYSVGRKSRKWWRYIAMFLFQVAMVNSMLLFDLSHRPKPKRKTLNTHLQYRLDVCSSLIAGNVKKGKRSENAVATAGLGANDPTLHQETRMHGRKRCCFQCSKRNRKTASNRGVETVYGCVLCQVNLCKGLCFSEFHTELAQRIRK